MRLNSCKFVALAEALLGHNGLASDVPPSLLLRRRAQSLQACEVRGNDVCGKRFCIETDSRRAGFTCGDCREGYRETMGLNGARPFCKDIDECVENDPCDDNATCSDEDPPRFFMCECNRGFRGDGVGKGSCTDIDECAEMEINCGPNAQCVNTPGSFECQCLAGFIHFEGIGCVDLSLARAETTTAPPSPSPLPPPLPRSFSMDFCQALDIENVLVTEEFEGSSTGGWENGKLSGRSAAFAPFTQFLGPFYQGDAFPSKKYQFNEFNVDSVEFAFQFIEGDSWDASGNHGPDRLLVQVEGDRGLLETIDFGAFGHQVDDSFLPSSGTSNSGIISWRRQSEPPSFIGGSSAFQDQIHTFLLVIPRTFFTDGDLTVTFMWDLAGNLDEFVGFDNIKILRCIDTVPSATPSTSPQPSASPSAPTVSPSMFPSASPSS